MRMKMFYPHCWFAAFLVLSGSMAVAAGATAATQPGGADAAALKKSAETLQKLLMAGVVYAGDNMDKWPQKLDELANGDLLKDKSLLVDPADAKKRPWVYHPWTPEQQKKLDISTTPVIWSPIDTPTGNRNVGFLDGHVETVHSKADVDALMKKAEAAAKP